MKQRRVRNVLAPVALIGGMTIWAVPVPPQGPVPITPGGQPAATPAQGAPPQAPGQPGQPQGRGGRGGLGGPQENGRIRADRRAGGPGPRAHSPRRPRSRRRQPLTRGGTSGSVDRRDDVERAGGRGGRRRSIHGHHARSHSGEVHPHHADRHGRERAELVDSAAAAL
jgi:hypothetical protein